MRSVQSRHSSSEPWRGSVATVRKQKKVEVWLENRSSTTASSGLWSRTQEPRNSCTSAWFYSSLSSFSCTPSSLSSGYEIQKVNVKRLPPPTLVSGLPFLLCLYLILSLHSPLPIILTCPSPSSLCHPFSFLLHEMNDMKFNFYNVNCYSRICSV